MRKFLLISIALFTAYTLNLNSQVWLDPFQDREDVTFYEIQEYAEEYFSERDITIRSQSWKPYKRWEWFWESRLMPDGTFPPPKIILNERENFNDNSNLKNNKVQNNENWQMLGPYQSSGGYNGMGRVNCIRKNPHNGDLWAGTASGGIWRSTNEGSSWTTNTDNVSAMQSLGVTDIRFHPTNSNLVFIASGDGWGGNTYSLGILESTNGGSDWNTTGLSWNVTQVRRMCRILIDPDDPDNMFTAGSYGIHKTTDGGDNWSRVRTGNFKDLEFKPGDPNTLYASGTEIWRTTDGGDNWSQLTNGVPTSNVRRIAIAVSDDNASALYALVGNTSNSLKGVYLSTNSGDSFSEIADDDPNMMGYKKDGSDDKGQVGYDLCIEANPDDWQEAWIGGINIWKTTDAGSNWEITTMWAGNHNDVTTVHADQHDLWYDDDSNTLYVGNDGGVYKTTNGGDDWSWIGSGIKATQFYKLSISTSDTTVYIGGTQDNGTKVHLANGNWNDVIGGDGMECIVNPDDKSIMYGSLYYGDIKKSTNGGLSFKKINDADNNGEYDDITEKGAWVTPYTLNPQNSKSLYVGMVNVWKSEDEGDSFSKISNFSGSDKLRNLVVAPSDSNTIYASLTNKLYRTTDGGTTWSQVTRPGSANISYLYVHNENSQKLWATNSGFSSGNKVFESTDGGDNWTNISDNLPNIPANCVIYQHDTDDKLWVGTDLGIYYKDDNMNEWSKYSSGFPNVIVNELEIYYDQNLIYAATYGRGMWKSPVPPALDKPTLVTPNDNSFGNKINNLSFDWQDVNNATQYGLQISTESDFSTTIYDDDVNNSEHQLSTTLNNYTKYYWRVRAKSGASISPWSDVFEFTTIVETATLDSPNDNSIGQDVSGQLEWNSVDGANSYNIQLAKDDQFTDLVFDDNATGLNINYSNLQHFTDHYWRVRVEDPSGDYTDWSDNWTFQTVVDKPTLLSPNNNDSELGFETQLTWEEVTGADNYNFQLSDDDQFSNLIFDENTTDKEFTATDLEEYTTYYWRVRAENTGNAGEWSETFSFLTQPGATELVSPEDSVYKQDLVVDFEWNDISYATNYLFEISTVEDFTSILSDTTLSGNSLSLSSLDYNTLYFWRIKVIANGDEGDYSTAYRFTTKLETPVQQNPADASDEQELSGTLDWSDVNGADSYELQIALDNNFSNIVANETVNEASYDYSQLSDFETYYWRIRGLNDNNSSDWSGAFSFTTKMDVVSLIFPENNSFGNDLEIDFEWSEKSYADSYEFQLSENQDLSNATTENSTINANTFSGLDYNKEYYWRVKTIAGNIESDWSTIYKFTTKLETPELQLPDSASVNQEQDGSVNWSSINGATTYQIQISENFDFSSNLIDKTISNNNYSYSGLEKNKKYYWRVKALNNDNFSDWSNEWTFSTPITKPLLNEPPNNTSNLDIGEITLKWVPLSGSEKHILNVSVDENFNNLIIDQEIVDSEEYKFNINNYNSVYYWRVKAVASNGSESDWSEAWSFSSTLPSPTLIYPENEMNEVEFSGELSWESVEEADSYNVQLAEDENFSALISEYSKNVITNKLDYDNLNKNSTYYWRVNSESDIATSQWSNTWEFTTKTVSIIETFESINSRIKIIPNPFSENANIKLNLGQSGNVSIVLTNINGTTIREVNNSYLNSGEYSYQINGDELSSGVYLLNVKIGNITKALKIVLQK